MTNVYELLNKKISARDKQKAKLEGDLEALRTKWQECTTSAKKNEQQLQATIKKLQENMEQLQSKAPGSGAKR